MHGNQGFIQELKEEGKKLCVRSAGRLKKIHVLCLFISNNLSIKHLEKLMEISIEGLELSSIDFDKILKILKQCNKCVQLHVRLCIKIAISIMYRWKSSGGGSQGALPLYKTNPI